jgi:hypothetical protein
MTSLEEMTRMATVVAGVMAVTTVVLAFLTVRISKRAADAARDTLRLQHDERVERDHRLSFDALTQLARATHELQIAAARVENRLHQPGEGPAADLALNLARGSYRVAYAAVSRHFDLPNCHALRDEAEVRRLILRADEALGEIEFLTDH